MALGGVDRSDRPARRNAARGRRVATNGTDYCQRVPLDSSNRQTCVTLGGVRHPQVFRQSDSSSGCNVDSICNPLGPPGKARNCGGVTSGGVRNSDNSADEEPNGIGLVAVLDGFRGRKWINGGGLVDARGSRNAVRNRIHDRKVEGLQDKSCTVRCVTLSGWDSQYDPIGHACAGSAEMTGGHICNGENMTLGKRGHAADRMASLGCPRYPKSTSTSSGQTGDLLPVHPIRF